jgi:hypothetical protein
MVAPAIPLDEILERDWQRQVVQLAKQLGWRLVYHTFDSRRSTHGFPDLVIVKDRVIFLELKREKSKLADEQIDWLRSLRAAGAEAYVARPRHLEPLARLLGPLWRDTTELDDVTRAEIYPLSTQTEGAAPA